MIIEKEKYELKKLYLYEFQLFDGDANITFNIIDINLDKMTIKVAVTNRGKISVLEYDLKTDKNNNLYFEYGPDVNKIEIDDFEKITD